MSQEILKIKADTSESEESLEVCFFIILSRWCLSEVFGFFCGVERGIRHKRDNDETLVVKTSTKLLIMDTT